MITFSVVRERHGWAVRTGDCMTTPFWSRALAIREADCLARSIRRHGEFADVVVEGLRRGTASGASGDADRSPRPPTADPSTDSPFDLRSRP